MNQSRRPKNISELCNIYRGGLGRNNRYLNELSDYNCHCGSSYIYGGGRSQKTRTNLGHSNGNLSQGKYNCQGNETLGGQGCFYGRRGNRHNKN